MKILAIDIGSSLIKCILVETKFSRFEIVLHDVLSVQDSLDSFSPNDQNFTAGQIEALREIEMRYMKNVDRIVTNLPFSLYSTRLMTFPFNDKRKISSAVTFAIEDEIPFDLDDCIISSHIFPSRTKETHVLTGFAPLLALENYVKSLENIHLSVDAIVPDQAAYASFFSKLKHLPHSKSIAIINMGHRKSTISIYRNGLPFLHRTSMIGGFHITQAIAKKYNISMPEAEVAKQDRAFLALPGHTLDEDQRFFATMIEEVLDPVFHDFDQTLMAYTSRTNEQIEVIYLSGGSSQISGINDRLSSRWNKEIQYLSPISELPNSHIHPQKNTELLLPTAVSLALSQVSGESKSTLNFRSGQLKNQKTSAPIKLEQFSYPLKVVSIIYLFILMSFIGQLFLLKIQLTQKEKKLDFALQSIFGRTSTSYLSTMKSSPKKLKENVEKKVEELHAQLKGGGEATAFSALDVIQTLSKAVPPSTIVEIKQMQLSSTNLTLQLESPSQKDAEKTISAISSLSMIKNPKSSPIEGLTSSGTRKKYSIASTLLLSKEGG